MRQQRPLVEVDGRLGGGACDVGVRGEVHGDVVAGGGVGQLLQLLHVAAHDHEPRVVEGTVRDAPRGPT